MGGARLDYDALGQLDLWKFPINFRKERKNRFLSFVWVNGVIRKSTLVRLSSYVAPSRLLRLTAATESAVNVFIFICGLIYSEGEFDNRFRLITRWKAVPTSTGLNARTRKCHWSVGWGENCNRFDQNVFIIRWSIQNNVHGLLATRSFSKYLSKSF